MAYLKGCGWRLRRVMFASKVSRFWSRLARLPGVFAWAGRLAFYRSITQLSRLIGGILGR
jgi:hypothetical protein